MPDIPNTNAGQSVLLSQGDGSNTAFWGPNNQGWSIGGTVSVTATTTSTPGVTLQSLAIGGFTNYLVTLSFSQSNTIATATAAISAQLLDPNNVVLFSSQIGEFNTTTHNSWSWSTILSSTNWGTTAYTLKLAAFTGGGSCAIGWANLTVVGLN